MLSVVSVEVYMCVLQYIYCLVIVISDVDVNSKKLRNDLFDDFQKISRLFLCEILNDLFWPVKNKCRNAQYKAFRLI